MSGDDPETQIQTVIDELVASGQEIGLQVAVVRQGRMVIDAVGGVADPDSGNAVSGETLFYAASTGQGVASSIHFSTGASEQKAINVRANPRVALITGCDTWDRGADIVVEGDAVRVTDHSQLERLASVWATKWDGRWQYEVRDDGLYHDGGGQVLVFSVAPTKILVFTKGTFSQTRHTFV